MAIQKKKLNDALTSSLITQKVPNMLTRTSLPIATGKYVNVVQLPYSSRIDMILSLFTYANQPPLLVLLSAQNAAARVVRMQKIGEMGNTQFGNNNAYCQDNEIGWLNWNNLEKNRDIHRFYKQMIAFRKAHSVLRFEYHLG